MFQCELCISFEMRDILWCGWLRYSEFLLWVRTKVYSFMFTITLRTVTHLDYKHILAFTDCLWRVFWFFFGFLGPYCNFGKPLYWQNRTGSPSFLFMLTLHCTAMHFASFLSGGFATMAVINPSERKLAKHISVHWLN